MCSKSKSEVYVYGEFNDDKLVGSAFFHSCLPACRPTARLAGQLAVSSAVSARRCGPMATCGNVRCTGPIRPGRPGCLSASMRPIATSALGCRVWLGRTPLSSASSTRLGTARLAWLAPR